MSADGGPAFPAMHFDLTDNEHGMSLRDYFAAKAMQGVAARGWPKSMSMDEVARDCWLMADAMLKARQS